MNSNIISKIFLYDDTYKNKNTNVIDQLNSHIYFFKYEKERINESFLFGSYLIAVSNEEEEYYYSEINKTFITFFFSKFYPRINKKI